MPEADGSGFGIENLPYGVVRVRGGEPEPAVRVGEHALLLRPLGAAGLPSADAFRAPTLNPFVERGPACWRAVREWLGALLRDPAGGGAAGAALVPLAEAEPVLPVEIGDYVDFYSSREHAENVGRIFRPEAEPLLPNWRRLPVGYQGRAGTVAVSGTPVPRPSGLFDPGADGEPVFGPEPKLDVEVELGAIAGPGPDPEIFGYLLVNDWSAREIQRYEYRPLGPFLGKSFLTSVSPWVVPHEALVGARVAGPPQDPPPAAHLAVPEPRALAVELELALVPAGSSREVILSRPDARGLYWSFEQQLAHATSNGATVRAGDLFASGTISSGGRAGRGSLLELSWNGTDPIELPDGSLRRFLEDGDTAVIRGRAGPVSLGEVRGTIV